MLWIGELTTIVVSIIFLSAASSHNGGFRDIFIDGFVPPVASVAPMFPFYENSAEWDDYGEVINPDDYIIMEEDMNGTSAQVSFFHTPRSLHMQCCNFKDMIICIQSAILKALIL